MDNICYDLALRQRKCQNNISVTSDNVYTNIANNFQILLSFGYVINIISKNNTSVTIEIVNFDLLEPVRFNIPTDTFRTFDLPMYNGTYIVLIGVMRNDNNCPCPYLIR